LLTSVQTICTSQKQRELQERELMRIENFLETRLTAAREKSENLELELQERTTKKKKELL